MKILHQVLVGLVVAFGVCFPAGAAGEQFIPVPVYKTGPVNAVGTGLFGGFIDYLDLVNKRDGGVGGVKLVWEECETAFQVDRTVECYERLKKKGPTGASFFMPYHTGSVYALTERARADRVPIVMLGAGRADASDGRVFPYSFPIGTSYWSANTIKIRYIGNREGGMDKLKGKKIVNLHMGNAFGKETMPVLEAQAKKYGFQVAHIEIPLPGMEQQAQWLQIRQLKPDWVILNSAGVQVPAALKMAQRMGYPADRIVGGGGTSAEEDVIPAGDAAKGFVAWPLIPSGAEYPVIQEIRKVLYSGGKKGNLEDPRRIGTVFHNVGVANGIMHTEAIRVAQGKYGKKPLTGEQIQWGFEHLNIDDKRLKQLGAVGLLPNIKTSCADHEGGGAAKFHQWNGSKWVIITDWIPSDQSIVRPLIEEAAAKYAKEKGLTPRDCSKEG